MFEKKELVSGIDGSTYTKYFYTFNEADKIVGILFGHFAPFTGPNGHGRMVTALKNIGAESFLIATPDNNKPFDDEREMFNSHQRAEIIQAYLDSEGLDGEAIAYKMKRGGAKSQMGPLVALAAEKFGLNIRPVFCFGPDREDLAADVCNKFGEITDPTHCEYIVDYERGTSGTKVRQLIKANDVDGIVSETGYKPEVAEKLIKLRMENKGMDEFKEAYEMKEWEDYNWRTVKLKFTEPQDAAEFKNEMKDKFNFPKNVSKYQVVHGITPSGGAVYVESFKKIYNEARTPWSFVGTTKEDRSSITGFLHSKGFNYLKSYENEKKAKEFSHYVHENYDDFYGEFLKSDLEDAWKDFNLNESKLTEGFNVYSGDDYDEYNQQLNYELGLEESRLKESEYSERERFSLTNPTEELEEIIEAIKDEYELETGEKPNLEISYRNGGNIDIEFEDLDNSSASGEILKPICKKLADKADKLNIRLSAYANEISILTVEPFGPRGDFFEKVYNNHPENNLIPLENPTPEVKKIAEFIQDMMRAWHGRKDKGELYRHGYEIYYVFKTLNYNDAMKLLNPIERELLGMYDDYIFGVGECRFGAYIDFYKKSDTEYYRSRGYK